MGRQPAARAAQHALHRPAVGVPRAHLDARPVHLAAPDHEDPLRPPGDGVAAPLLQPHRLSQYWRHNNNQVRDGLRSVSFGRAELRHRLQ